MSRETVTLHSDCGHSSTDFARCDPVFWNSGKCKGEEKPLNIKEKCNCEPCWQKEINDLDKSIDEGKARLRERAKENGKDYMGKLEKRMHKAGYKNYRSTQDSYEDGDGA